MDRHAQIVSSLVGEWTDGLARILDPFVEEQAVGLNLDIRSEEIRNWTGYMIRRDQRLDRLYD